MAECNGQEISSDQETLILCLSRTGNTQAIVEINRQEVGGEWIELELEAPCPENEDEIVAQVDRENETVYIHP